MKNYQLCDVIVAGLFVGIAMFTICFTDFIINFFNK